MFCTFFNSRSNTTAPLIITTGDIHLVIHPLLHINQTNRCHSYTPTLEHTFSSSFFLNRLSIHALPPLLSPLLSPPLSLLVAGNGVFGSVGDGGPAVLAQLYNPIRWLLTSHPHTLNTLSHSHHVVTTPFQCPVNTPSHPVALSPHQFNTFSIITLFQNTPPSTNSFTTPS